MRPSAQPAAPVVTQAPPPAPTKTEAVENTAEERAALRRRVGRSGDIVTGPLGVKERAPVNVKTLLGE